jgi:hypothetical protein
VGVVTAVPLPARLHIGPLTYIVEANEERSRDSECYGFADTGRTVIVVDPAMSASKTRETVMHETLHTLMELVGVSKGGKFALLADQDDEERLVTALAPWLLDTLRRNPALATFLLAD